MKKLFLSTLLISKAVTAYAENGVEVSISKSREVSITTDFDQGGNIRHMRKH